MERHHFLAGAVASAVGAVALAAPAIAQTMPTIKWRLASSFPKTLDTIYGAADLMSKRVAAATDGKFDIQLFAPGEIVPGLQVLDAVQNGTVQMGHTSSYYYVGKDPAFCFDTAMPFGLNARQQNAWMAHGGGDALMQELFKAYNVHRIPCGNTGAQMGGWYRKEIKTVDDLKGLKLRIAGIAGQVMQKLGVIPQQLAGPDVYPALEKGTIDAVEWVGPYDDEKLGFVKVAPNYYYPGWWEGGPQIALFINQQQWETLPPTYRTILELACAEANADMLARYDALNPPALRRLIAAGAKLQPFPRAVMEASYKASNELYEEIAAANPRFKKIYEPWKKFRDDQFTWFRFAENTYDNFTFSAAERVR